MKRSQRLIKLGLGMAFCGILPLMAVSCSNRAGKSADSDSAAVADSVVKEPSRLPDTVMASVDAINYKVEVLDSATDGRLESLRDLYAEAPGIMTFRGGPQRNAPYTGELKSAPSKIEVAWRFRTGADAKWGGGSGWTGQPVYVKWPEKMAAEMKSKGAVNANFRGEEIIVGSLDGNVYFIDPQSGQATREKIRSGNPIKGSVSLDPTLNGYLYVGQGIPNERPFGAQTIDLKNNSIVSTFDMDPKAQRAWGAYDSSALRVGQFVFRPGENGTLYKWLPTADGIRLHSTLRFTRGGGAPGIESSIAVWSNYGYFCDNAGNVVCVNLDTMKPVWHYDNHDDSDSSPIVIPEGGHPYVYTASEIDRQGTGFGYFVKLDGLTGLPVWEAKIDGKRYDSTDNKKHFDGGFYATPLPGRADCEGILFAPVVYNLRGQNGGIIAIDTKTGKTLWSTDLKAYPWSSPVALTTPDGKMWIFAGDTAGNGYVINGKTGDIVATAPIGNNFESSPIVICNSLYVGSRGDTIFKITIS